MTWLIQTLITASLAFAVTNLDDMVMLLLLFAQGSSRFLPHQIVCGQYLGFAVLVGLSLPGFLGGLVLPRPWIGLLGIVPIVMGCRGLFPQDDPAEVQLTSTISLPLLNPRVASVAALTVANGGDNIGVYVSLFAGQSWVGLGLTLLVFVGLLAVWCGVAYALVHHPAVGDRLTRYGHYVVPPVLIGLGLFIMAEHETYRLFMG